MERNNSISSIRIRSNSSARCRTARRGFWEGQVWSPSVEVAEQGWKLVVRADLPGLTKNDVTVELREDAACIKGERRQHRESKRKGFYCSERS